VTQTPELYRRRFMRLVVWNCCSGSPKDLPPLGGYDQRVVEGLSDHVPLTVDFPAVGAR
jgi:hypothetical protein